jgi:sec-independent protein translocase protein TatB
MFDIGWTEMLVIAVVMIVVVGPKDLPRMLRTFGKTTTKLRAMAGDFQKQFNEALKEAELDDVKKSVDSLRTLNPMAEIRKQLNPFEQAAADVKAGVDAALKPAQPAATEAAASTEPTQSEVAGEHVASVLPGPTEMPATPVFPAVSADTASPVTAPAAPLKAGPTALPGEAVRFNRPRQPRRPRRR